MFLAWQGVFPALTTKFTATDELDLPLFEKNLQAQLDAGIDGLIVGGSLGEASVLTTAEKEILVKQSLNFVQGKIPVILNIAEGSTTEAIQQAACAHNWGAQGIMLLPPMRYKSDHRETVEFFKAVAGSTSLPVMIYNNPVDYKIDVTPDMFEELLQCPNIEAVKDSTRDITNVTRLKNRFGDRLKVLCGVDPLAMEALLMGADGWVAGLVCAFPAETVTLYRLIKNDRLTEALQLFRWFLPLLELDIHPKLVQYIKLAEAQTGLGSEYVRAPRLVLTGEERERVLKTIKDSMACRPEIEVGSRKYEV